jgi:hypothetical protein
MAQVGEYAIELVSLDPYPQTPDDALALEQYRATLVMRKSAPSATAAVPSTR